MRFRIQHYLAAPKEDLNKITLMMPHHPSTPSAHTSDTITLNNSTVHNLPYFFSACVAGRRLPMLAGRGFDEEHTSITSTSNTSLNVFAIRVAGRCLPILADRGGGVARRGLEHSVSFIITFVGREVGHSSHPPLDDRYQHMRGNDQGWKKRICIQRPR